MDLNNLYSHTYVVGMLNAESKPNELSRYDWDEVVMLEKDFVSRKMDYYTSLLDSMMKTKGRAVPEFLKEVCHYKAKMDKVYKDIEIKLPEDDKTRKPERTYKFMLCSIDLYCFPLGIVLFVIEIDDSGCDLDDMTYVHGLWKEWGNFCIKNKCDYLERAMAPIENLLRKENKDLSQIAANGTKTKMYQIVITDKEEVDDALLYEIGSFSPIGVVNADKSFKKKFLKPSKEYFDLIMKENTVSAFDNWKGLALNDSFTVLASGEKEIKNDGTEVFIFNSWPQENLYFPLLYLRCFFEKCFCFSRNTQYRRDKDGRTDNVEKLLREISNMDRYYFYDDISYNFLPPMIYRSIKKGMNLETDLEEMKIHIKENLQEERRQRYNMMLYVVTAFAAFSVSWSLYSFIDEIMTADTTPNFWKVFFLVLSFLLFGTCLILMYLRTPRKPLLRKRP